MKIKLLTLALCAFLVVLVFSGCGLKMPETSDTSPSGEASSSPTGSTPTGEAVTGTTTVTGIVSFVDNGTIKIDLVKQSDAPTVDDTQTLTMGSTVFAVTGESYSVNTDSGTAVVLGHQGYVSGTISDIKESDFLAVVVRDNTAITIVNGGPSGTYTPDTGDGSPSAEPTDPSAAPTAGVPDSSVKTVYTVITDGLKARSGPGTDNSVLGILDTGSRVTGTVSDGWLTFTYDGKTAYCSAEFLEVSTAPAGVPDSSTSKTYKTADSLKARSGPGTTYAALGTLDKGTKVTGTIANGWLKFTYEDKTAYCSASYLEAG